jgi:NhaP-type Na+/H+ or K+/H+ antiporter
VTDGWSPLFIVVAVLGVALGVLALYYRRRGERRTARRVGAVALLLLVVPAVGLLGILGLFVAGLFVVVAGDLLVRGRGGKTWEDEAREQWDRDRAESGGSG